MAKVKKEKSLEETLWQQCDKLRGTVEHTEYKHVDLALIFLKFASDKFEHRRANKRVLLYEKCLFLDEVSRRVNQSI